MNVLIVQSPKFSKLIMSYQWGKAVQLSILSSVTELCFIHGVVAFSTSEYTPQGRSCSVERNIIL